MSQQMFFYFFKNFFARFSIEFFFFKDHRVPFCQCFRQVSDARPAGRGKRARSPDDEARMADWAVCTTFDFRKTKNMKLQLQYILLCQIWAEI